MTVYICPSYLKEILFHELSRSKGMPGCSAVSLNRLLQIPAEEPADLLRFIQNVHSCSDAFPVTGHMFSFPAFFHEIFSFARELALLQISADVLPCRTVRETELKQLIAIAQESMAGKTAAVRNTEFLTENNSGEYVLAPYASGDLFVQNALLQLQGKIPSLSFAGEPKTAVRRHAVTQTAEIEAIAQDLILHPAPANIILCSPQVQLPVLQTIFRQYGINWSCTIYRDPVKLPAVYRSLVLFAIHSDPEHLVSAAQAGGFTEDLAPEVCSWLENHLSADLQYHPGANFYAAEMAAAAGRKDDPAHRSDDVKMVLRMDRICSQWLSAAAREIELLKNNTPEEAFRNAYTLIAHSRLLQSPAERTAGMNLRKQISSLLGQIHSIQDAEMILAMMTAEDTAGSRLKSDTVMVTDLLHPVPFRSITYVAGCTGTAYPGTSARHGLFDERYLSLVPEYPSLEARTALYRRQMEWVSRSAEKLIYSYPTNDSKGRILIPAFELSGLPDERWQICRCSAAKPAVHQLQPDTALRLFTQQEDSHSFIRGSVSSIEAWFQCPYRGFLSSGLYVRKKEIPALDAATIGTLQHAVMEKAMLASGDKYAADLQPDVIAEMLSPCFKALEAADPSRREILEFARERLTRSIRLAAEFLELYSRHTVLKPWKPETRFDRFDITPHVRLNGTVDRIDYDPQSHQMSVIDYKSSAKSLSPAKYAEGLQLQLMSYLFSILEGNAGPADPDRIPACAVYFSMKEAYPETIPAAKVNRTRFELKEPDFTKDSEDIRKAYIACRAMKGWKFLSDSVSLDNTGFMISGKVYALSDLRRVLSEVYEWFYDSAAGRNQIDLKPKTGELPRGIELRPVAGACTFCDYAAICRFHGEYRTPAEITEAPKAVSRSGKEKKS